MSNLEVAMPRSSENTVTIKQDIPSNSALTLTGFNPGVEGMQNDNKVRNTMTIRMNKFALLWGEAQKKNCL